MEIVSQSFYTYTSYLLHKKKFSESLISLTFEFYTSPFIVLGNFCNQKYSLWNPYLFNKIEQQ